MVTVKTQDGIFTINTGPPILLTNEDSEWLIVSRPLLSSFSTTSRRWYDVHPDVPEKERRLQAWLEENLIDWLPLVSDDTHNTLRAAICDAVTIPSPPSTPEKAMTTPRDFSEKLILRSASGEKNNSLHAMSTFTITFDAKTDDYKLKTTTKDTEIAFSSPAVDVWESIPALADNEEVINFWRWLMKNEIRPAKPLVFTVDADGLHSSCSETNKFLTEHQLSAPPQSCESDPIELAKLVAKVGDKGSCVPALDAAVVPQSTKRSVAVPQKKCPPLPKKKLNAPDTPPPNNSRDQKKLFAIPKHKTTPTLIDPFGMGVNVGGFVCDDCKKTCDKTYNVIEQDGACQMVCIACHPETLADTPAVSTPGKDGKEDEWKGGIAGYEYIKDSPVFSTDVAETPAVSTPMPEVYRTRVGEKELPAIAWVQRGEIFSGKIKWEEPVEKTLSWSKSVGIQTDECDYACFEATQAVYLYYDEPLFDQEHCMQIVKLPDIPALREPPAVEDEDLYRAFPLGEFIEDTYTFKLGRLVTEGVILQRFFDSMVKTFSQYENCYVPKDLSELDIETTRDFDIRRCCRQVHVKKNLKRKHNPKCTMVSYATSGGLNLSFYILLVPRDILKCEDCEEEDCKGDEETVDEEEAEEGDEETVDTVDDEEDVVADEDDDAVEGEDEEAVEDEENEEDENEEEEEDTVEDDDVQPTIQEILDSDDTKKLNSPEPAVEKDNKSSILTKNVTRTKNMTSTKTIKNTITMTEVATLFCDLGIGLAAHFDLDTAEVVKYLDGVCEDLIGVNPESTVMFEEVRAESEQSEEAGEETNVGTDDENEIEDAQLTKDQVEIWFLPLAKGGLKVADIRKEAKELGLDVTNNTKRAALQSLLLELCEPEQSGGTLSDEDVEDVKGVRNPIVHQSEYTSTITQTNFDEWFAVPSKGGLKLTDLKGAAGLFGMVTNSKTTKKDIQTYVAQFIESDDEDEPNVEENDERSETQAPTITQSDFDVWFSATTKGGMKIKELQTTAKEFGMKTNSKTKKSDIKSFLSQFIVPDEEEIEEQSEEIAEEVQSDEDQPLTITQSDFDVWFSATTKGGMKMKELKETAKEFGMKTNSKTKKIDIKYFLSHFIDLLSMQQKTDLRIEECNEECSEEIDDEQSEDQALTITQSDFDMWFSVASKGGLKMTELRQKAREFGMDTNSKTKKDIKLFMEELVIPDEEEVEDEIEEEVEEPEQSEEEIDQNNEEEPPECCFVYTKGPQRGKKCTTKPKAGGEFCGKHKACKSVSSTPTSRAPARQCLYVGTRGPTKDKQCAIKPKDGEDYCAKHTNTQQAINYKANESPAARKAKKQTPPISSAAYKIIRNKNLKIWVVEGENLVVKSPKNPTVYAYLTKKNTLVEKVTNAVKILAEELGLSCEAGK